MNERELCDARAHFARELAHHAQQAEARARRLREFFPTWMVTTRAEVGTWQSTLKDMAEAAQEFAEAETRRADALAAREDDGGPRAFIPNDDDATGAADGG